MVVGYARASRESHTRSLVGLQGLRDFLEVRRLVRVAAAPARSRFGDSVEGVQRHDRGQKRVAAVKRNECLPTPVGLGVDNKRRGAERGETLERIKEPRASRVRGREGENGKSRLDDPGRPMQHFGGRKGFGVDCRGFLELERGLGGDGMRGAPSDDEQ